MHLFTHFRHEILKIIDVLKSKGDIPQDAIKGDS
jgi:hypothetical protein